MNSESGFHPDFRMLVYHKDDIDKVSVDEWLEWVEGIKTDNPEMWQSETRYTFDLVDIAGNAAAAELNVHKGKAHFSTDYMLLYKFRDGWKVVSKIFSMPANPVPNRARRARKRLRAGLSCRRAATHPAPALPERYGWRASPRELYVPPVDHFCSPLRGRGGF